MSQGVEVVGLYVRDQDEALAFYVEQIGFRVHTDVRNGDYRWLTVQHPDQPSFQLGLFSPGPPVLDAATAQTLRAIVARGAMPPLVLTVDDCARPMTGCVRREWSSRRNPWTASVPWTLASATRRGTDGR